MRIAILTSSRADYGIYLPLLHGLKNDPFFELSIIAFGSHTAAFYGETVNQIINDGFEVPFRLDTLLTDDSVHGIAQSYGRTVTAFADFWAGHTDFDWVICLGDRFEMSAAVQALIPYQLKIAHLHAGETTLGAIDNIYRHQMTLAAKLHFVSHPVYAERVREITGLSGTSELVGSLSLLNLKNTELESEAEFLEKWGVSLSKKFLLVTVHPETVNFDKNKEYAATIGVALENCLPDFDVVITMPNADTDGQIYRERFKALALSAPGKVHLIENFGTKSYFTAMKHAALLVGNSSSGIIEAASFGRYVLNIGDRQKGRIAPENVKHVRFDEQEIRDAVFQYQSLTFEGENPFDVPNGVELMMERLKNDR
jgi:GDP/UDP-N,N'-diacetylbacillosamine 2-epimerase (hydrolysing)